MFSDRKLVCKIAVLLPVVSENLPDHDYMEQNNNVNSKNYICDIYDFDDVTVDDIKNVTFTEYKTNVVDYVSGFMVKLIVRELNCDLCISFLKIHQSEFNYVNKNQRFRKFSYISITLKITETVGKKY